MTVYITHRRTWLAAAFLGALLGFATPRIANAQARQRPLPAAMPEMASPVTGIQVFGKETEGSRYIKELPAPVRKELAKKGYVLLNQPNEVTASFGGYIRAVVLLKNSKKRAWELMAAPAKQPEFLPRLVSAKVLATMPNGQLIRYAIQVFAPTFTYHTQHWFYPEISRMEWGLDLTRQNDIKWQDGYWQLYQVNADLTVAEYGTRIDTGLAVPQAMQDVLSRQDIPGAMESFKKYIDSNGSYRRPE